jgi:hypothetical protein
MVPLVVYLAYALSLSAAMNSGGRYLVPMDWAFYFYYALALVVVIKFILGVVSRKGPQPAGQPETEAAGAAPERRLLGFAFAGVIVLASLLPIANLLVPAVAGDAAIPADVEAIRMNLAEQENAEVLYGEVLYPYYSDDATMFFELMMPQGFRSYTLTRDPELSVELTGGEHVFIVQHAGTENNLQIDAIYVWQVDALYLWQGTEPLLIWERQP